MKIYHISDLHIGRRMYSYSLTEIQRKVLKKIVQHVKEERPDVLVIAGDIYDKSVPSGDAFLLLDEFLTQLAELEPGVPVLLIAGNHDHGKKLQYASSFLEQHQIYIASRLPKTKEEYLKKVVLRDEYGPVHFYLMPYLSPADARNLYPEREFHNYEEAVRVMLERESWNPKERNVLVAHQFFISKGSGEEPIRSESEGFFTQVGGIDSVDVELVKDFDYVALGHIHGAQKVGYEHVRYSGAPYKYSVSEQHQKKGITVVTLGEKGTPCMIERREIVAEPEVRSIKGKLADVLQAATEENRDDFVEITLTDEEIYRPVDLLREKYRHILEVKIENGRTKQELDWEESAKELDTLEAFEQFFEEMNGYPLNERAHREMEDVIMTCTTEEERE